mmetsp:Transcript_45501/g.95521  ORF Transcript_45501/g.95521 Transcript_45501/m.95521 type:complete len:133 (+) Transcript_45501:128-526(+)
MNYLVVTKAFEDSFRCLTSAKSPSLTSAMIYSEDHVLAMCGELKLSLVLDELYPLVTRLPPLKSMTHKFDKNDSFDPDVALFFDEFCMLSFLMSGVELFTTTSRPTVSKLVDINAKTILSPVPQSLTYPLDK